MPVDFGQKVAEAMVIGFGETDTHFDMIIYDCMNENHTMRNMTEIINNFRYRGNKDG